MRSLVQAAVLALVIERPSYGGEIGSRFEERYFGLLGSKRQHVYESLNVLCVAGLIERVMIELEDGSTREGFRATAIGAERYRTWLRSPIEISHDTRRQVLIRLACTRAEDLATIEHLLELYELAVLELARKRPKRTANLTELALDEERRVVTGAMVRWIAWARDHLRVSGGRA